MNTLKPGFTNPLLNCGLKVPVRALLDLEKRVSGHCKTLARSVYNQRAFDWLDEIFQTDNAS